MTYIFSDDDFSEFITHPDKPIVLLEAIYNKLEPCGEEFTINKDEMIEFFNSDGKPCFTFITGGRFSIYRKHDDLLMHSSSSPSLFGVVEYFQPRNAHFILADTQCTGIKVSADLASKIFTKHELWDVVCKIQTYFIQVLQTRDFQLVGVNAYLIIKNKLFELLQEPEEVRLRQSVLLYIQLRSKLSKSVVSKILAALREGDYICMNRGKLVSIKYLPKDY